MPEPKPLPNVAAEVRRLRDCLQEVDFLYHLNFNELDMLLAAIKKRHYPKGYSVIKQGEKGDAFYMVSSGKLSVWVKKGFNNERVAFIGAGQFFGEGALVNNQPRSATVNTEEDTELYILHKDAFTKILMANPSIAADIKMQVTKRKQ